MKNYLMIVHRFSEPGFDLIDVKGKYKAAVKRCHGQSTLKRDKYMDTLLVNLFEIDNRGSPLRIVPEQFRANFKVSGIGCLETFGTTIAEINGRDGEFTLSVLYWDVEPETIPVLGIAG